MTQLRNSLRALLLVSCWLLVGRLALSSEMAVTDSFDEVSRRVMVLAGEYGPHEVLLVCDIDNTLLAMNQDLGAVAWFDDQYRLLKESPHSDELVARDLESLLRVQGMLFTLSRMHPPEKIMPQRIAALHEKGIYTLCLTSRGPAFRNATEESLRQCRFDFARGEPVVVDRFRGERLPYDPKDVAASGISRDEARRFRLTEPKPASYDKGIFMVSGQNKGGMLLILLAHCPRRFSAIVFVDDTDQHVKDVFSALAGRGIEIVAYRYSREDRAVEEFHKSGRKKAHRQWKRLQRTLEEVFP